MALSAIVGASCALFYLVIPEASRHGLPVGDDLLGLLVWPTLLFAALFYAAMIEDEPGRNTWAHLGTAGIVAGVASVCALHALLPGMPFDASIVAMSAVIGAVLAMTGAFGFIARGL